MAQKTIMAIGGHIGDMELTTGGVLATLALKGWKVITVALTPGEKGNPAHLTVAQYREQKYKEAEAFARDLGGEAVVLPTPDGELEVNEANKYELCDIIRKYKPDVLLTHWKNSMHKDHEATYQIVRDAQFYAALPGYERELPPHFAAGPYYAENWEDPEGFTPYLYMEVSDEGYDLWSKAINHHWFTSHSTSFEYQKYYKALMEMRGALSRKNRAQCFNQDEYTKRLIQSEF